MQKNSKKFIAMYYKSFCYFANGSVMQLFLDKQGLVSFIFQWYYLLVGNNFSCNNFFKKIIYKFKMLSMLVFFYRQRKKSLCLWQIIYLLLIFKKKNLCPSDSHPLSLSCCATDKCGLKQKVSYCKIFLSAQYFLSWSNIFLTHGEIVKITVHVPFFSKIKRRLTLMFPSHLMLELQIM